MLQKESPSLGSKAREQSQGVNLILLAKNIKQAKRHHQDGETGHSLSFTRTTKIIQEQETIERMLEHQGKAEAPPAP